MKAQEIHLLLIEDNPGDAIMVQEYLREVPDFPFALTHRTSLRDGLEALKDRTFDAVLLDLDLPDSHGMDTFLRLLEVDDQVPVILLTGLENHNLEAEALRKGAQDYLTRKKLDGHQLTRAIRHAVQRTLAHRAIRDSEDLYRTLVETSPDAVGLLDLDLNYIMANKRNAQLLGLDSLEDLVGKNILEFIDPGDLAQATTKFDRLRKHGTANNQEITLRTTAGVTLKAEINAAVMYKPSREPVSVIAILRDITERNEMRAMLSQSDRMASLGLLAAGVAHEINNPLTYIIYNVESLTEELSAFAERARGCRDRIADRIGEKQATALLDGASTPCLGDQVEDLADRARQAADGARRVRMIVSDLKLFAAADDDSRAPISINSAIKTAANMALNEIKFRARLVKDLGQIPPVNANEGRLCQVFLNLLVNAAHAIEEGSVDDNEIKVTSALEGNMVMVKVEDTGCGMDEQTLSRALEPFFTTKPVGVGSGLGLSICKNIVETHGGSLWATSSPRKGSCFYVSLPVATREDIARSLSPSPVARAVPEVSGKRILIIDDEPMVCKSISRVLRNRHHVTSTSSGAEAMQMLAGESTFDLILCDMMMPGVSGMDLYYWLRERDPDLASRMVFITGGVFTPQAMAFVKEIPNLQLDKPIEPAELISIVNELMAG